MVSARPDPSAPCRDRAESGSEAGFTLVEALCAIVILAVGLVAVSNLLVVAASSNTVANQGTAAVSIASEQIERLKAIPFTNLAVGGSLTADVPGVPPSPDFFRDDTLQGVGGIHTRWQIAAIAGDNQVLFIQVRSEGTGALVGARSRAEFATFRSCTNTTIGCPAP